jgi:putative redox protein
MDMVLRSPERTETMTSSNDQSIYYPQATVAGDLSDGGGLNGRAGSSKFSVGGPGGRGGVAVGANPYQLLSASLAACTAMTIRLQARRGNYPLSHVEVGVSYHKRTDGGRDTFVRTIYLEGNLNREQRAQLIEGANMCPVGRTLGLSADIRTHDTTLSTAATDLPADYDRDLTELPIPYIDAD